MNGRFARSIQVAKESYAVLRGNPTLILFPILSTIAGILVSLPFLAPIVIAVIGQYHAHHSHASHLFGTVQWVLVALMGFANYFVIVFFNSALIACASEELNGRHSTVAFGIEMAMKRLPQIFAWALIGSTVGLILRTIGERLGVVGSIVTSIIGLAWNLAVFFVVPCLILDRVSPIEAVKTSTGMLKKTWGEFIILDGGLGMTTALFMLLCIVPFGLGIACFVNEMFWFGGLLMFLGLVYIAMVAVAASSMTTIFQTALYIYCRTGEVPSGFGAASIQGAFREKPVRKVFGRRF